jgi:hypothetical protein
MAIWKKSARLRSELPISPPVETVGSIPNDGHVPAGIGCYPGEYIRLPGLGRALGYLQGRRPGYPQSGRVGVIDVCIVRPDRV